MALDHIASKMLEDIFERINQNGHLIAIVLLIGALVYRGYRYPRNAKSPPMVPYYIPFGLDTIWEVIKVRISGYRCNR